MIRGQGLWCRVEGLRRKNEKLQEVNGQVERKTMPERRTSILKILLHSTKYLIPWEF